MFGTVFLRILILVPVTLLNAVSTVLILRISSDGVYGLMCVCFRKAVRAFSLACPAIVHVLMSHILSFLGEINVRYARAAPRF